MGNSRTPRVKIARVFTILVNQTVFIASRPRNPYRPPFFLLFYKLTPILRIMLSSTSKEDASKVTRLKYIIGERSSTYFRY